MEQFLLGTYTRTESEGIYTIQLNHEAKQLEQLSLQAHLSNPTYLDTNSTGSLLFSVVKKDEMGGVVSYQRNQTTGTYDQVDEVLQEGAAPCYVSYDEPNALLYTANYHEGEVLLYRVSETGTLNLLDKVAHTGSSVHPNQEGPHAHYIARTRDRRFIVACDLGTDEVITYSVEDNRLHQTHVFQTPPGTGPRHLVFHPTLQTVYVIGELSNELLVLTYREDGSFALKQTVSLLPDDYSGESSGAAVRVSSDGAFVYASNRGHNSIVVYQVDSTNGTVTAIQWHPTFGETPRDFNLDAREHFLLIGHQHTPTLTLLERHADSGRLELRQKDVYAPEVVCIQRALP